MLEELRQRLQTLGRRAGMTDVPPAAVAAAALCMALAVGLAAWHWWPRAQTVVLQPESQAVAIQRADAGELSDVAAESSEDQTATICVHVAGAVRNPGVYTLPAGIRMVAAIEAAGGLSPDAAQEGVNLAREVADGEQVVVPTRAEYVESGSTVQEQGNTSAGSSGAAGKPVNINTADATALDTLPGIGPATAEKIIADREANGPFKSTSDLGRVSGFGDKKLAQLEGLICVK